MMPVRYRNRHAVASNIMNSITVVYLPPATKLRQGNVFAPVCQSFCSQGEGVSVRESPLGRDPPRQTPWTETPLDRDSPDRDPLDRDPWIETPLDRDSPRTVTPLDRDPPLG